MTDEGNITPTTSLSDQTDFLGFDSDDIDKAREKATRAEEQYHKMMRDLSDDGSLEARERNTDEGREDPSTPDPRIIDIENSSDEETTPPDNIVMTARRIPDNDIQATLMQLQTLLTQQMTQSNLATQTLTQQMTENNLAQTQNNIRLEEKITQSMTQLQQQNDTLKLELTQQHNTLKQDMTQWRQEITQNMTSMEDRLRQQNEFHKQQLTQDMETMGGQLKENLDTNMTQYQDTINEKFKSHQTQCIDNINTLGNDLQETLITNQTKVLDEQVTKTKVSLREEYTKEIMDSKQRELEFKQVGIDTLIRGGIIRENRPKIDAKLRVYLTPFDPQREDIYPMYLLKSAKKYIETSEDVWENLKSIITKYLHGESNPIIDSQTYRRSKGLAHRDDLHRGSHRPNQFYQRGGGNGNPNRNARKYKASHRRRKLKASSFMIL